VALARTVILAAAALVAAALLSAAAPAAELTSTSYRQLGGHLNASASHALTSPSFDGGGTLGQSAAVGFSAAVAALDTHAAGFWPIAEGELPSLDADGDNLAAFLDPDDDNDFLLDSVETGTGVFVSASDTGTSPNLADSDGDGLEDGVEVAGGSDPNDADSPGPPSAVPSATPFGSIALVGLIAAAGAWRGWRAQHR
jgi:hypothetical protein